ncbi:MAG: tetratricopeptide repeat protein [Bacteroidales bacterium]|nr:tetratricopeptide repeat protein [Bacteroidales bacterium]
MTEIENSDDQVKYRILLFFLLPVICSPLMAQTIDDCDSLIKSGVVFMYSKDHVKSLELLTRAKTMADVKHWYRQSFLAMNNIGANYYSMLDYGEALNHYLDAYTIAIRELDEDHEMIVLNNIAILYSKEKQFDKAEEYFKKAYNIAKKKQAKVQLGMYAVNLGIVANEREQAAVAKEYLDEAMVLLQDQPAILINAEIGLAANYLLRRDYSQAKEIALQVLPKLGKEETSENSISVLFILSKIYQAENDLESAINFAQQALTNSLLPEDKISLYERLAALYIEKNDLKAALQAKDSVISAQEEFNQIKNGRLFETNRVKFEIQNYQRELQDNQLKLVSERRTFYIILAVAFLIIVLIAWSLRNSFIKNKQRKIIHKRSNEILGLELEKKNTDNILLEKQLKEKETLALLEQERLKNEIENRNRKLATKALLMSNRNELIEEIINSISNQPGISGNLNLKTHVQQLRNHLKNDTEWESFLTHFEEVNHGFLKALKENHPDLSSNDIRFLSYVYINLSTKEISLLLNITPEACRKRKERISYKMKLPDETDLYAYLSGI